MNNDTNNNFNSNVLGSVSPQSNNPSGNIPSETPETLFSDNNTNNTNNVNPGFTVMVDKPQPATLIEPNASTSNTPNIEPVNNGTTNSNVMAGVPPLPDLNPVNPAPTANSVNPAPMASSIEPNYTNPQSIGNMPGFDKSSVAGTTPPISLENEKAPKKKKNNSFLFIILIVLALGLVGGGVYFLLSKTSGGNANKTTINTKDFEWNLGEELPEEMSYYADITGTAEENCNKLRENVDINRAGEYEFAIQCGGTIRKGKITIVDNRTIDVTPVTVYKVVGDTVDAKEFAQSLDSDLSYEFVNQNEISTKVNTVGVHTIKIKATSTNNKELEFDAKLIVTQYKIKTYYTCTISHEEIKNDIIESGATESVDYRFVISDSETDLSIYGGLTQEIHTFNLKNASEYKALKEAYNKDKKLVINDLEANPLNVIFNDNSLSVKIIKELDNNTLINDHGAETFVKYGTLSQHFKIDLGYACVISSQTN